MNDSRIAQSQELNPKIKYDKSERFILFGDEVTPSSKYTLRKLFISNGHSIEISLVQGSILKGIVSTCPTLEFVEVFEQRRMQYLGIVPVYSNAVGNIMLSGGEREVQHKPTNIDINLNTSMGYPATGAEALTEGFKNQFDVTLQKFAKIAYAR